MANESGNEDLKALANIFSALSASASNPESYKMQLEQVIRDFDQLLQQQIADEKNNIGQALSLDNAALHVLTPTRNERDVVERIKKISGLTEKQISLVIKLGVLKIDQYGRPTLVDIQRKLISRNKGAAYLFVLGVLSGMIIGKIILQPMANLVTIFDGLGFGLAIGSVAGFILDRSLRAHPIIDELKRFTPWIALNS